MYTNKTNDHFLYWRFYDSLSISHQWSSSFSSIQIMFKSCDQMKVLWKREKGLWRRYEKNDHQYANRLKAKRKFTQTKQRPKKKTRIRSVTQSSTYSHRQIPYSKNLYPGLAAWVRDIEQASKHSTTRIISA